MSSETSFNVFNIRPIDRVDYFLSHHPRCKWCWQQLVKWGVCPEVRYKCCPKHAKIRDRRHMDIQYEFKETSLQRRRSLSDISNNKIVNSLQFWKRDKKNPAQTQSPLFSKLPPEIRLIIWEYVFDMGGPLHIKSCLNQHHVKAINCRKNRQPQRSSKRAQNSPYEHINCRRATNKCLSVAPKNWNSPPLSVMLTCRRIYSETAALLYRLNTFDFSYSEDALSGGIDLTDFVRAIPASRLQLIRSLVIYTDAAGPGPDLKWWSRVESALKRMTGLRKARIVRFMQFRHSYNFKEDVIDSMIRERIADWPHRDAFSVETAGPVRNPRDEYEEVIDYELIEGKRHGITF